MTWWLTVHDIPVVDVLSNQGGQQAVQALSDVCFNITIHWRLSQHIHILIHLGTKIGPVNYLHKLYISTEVWCVGLQWYNDII